MLVLSWASNGLGSYYIGPNMDPLNYCILCALSLL